MMSYKILLYCRVFGDEPGDIFSVQIEPNKHVVDLTFQHVDAKNLTLYKVSIPFAELDAKLGTIGVDDMDKLRPTQRLSQVFLDGPLEDQLHIIVRRPSGECR